LSSLREWRVAKERNLLRHPIDANADREAALRQHINGGEHLGGKHRLTEWKYEHRGEKSNAASRIS